MLSFKLVGIDYALERRRCGTTLATVDQGATQQSVGLEFTETWATELDLN